MVNTHSLTNNEMVLLDAMDVQDGRIVYGEVDKRHWRKEGKHYGCRGNGSRPFVTGDVPVVITEIEADLALDDRIHQ